MSLIENSAEGRTYSKYRAFVRDKKKKKKF